MERPLLAPVAAAAGDLLADNQIPGGAAVGKGNLVFLANDDGALFASGRGDVAVLVGLLLGHGVVRPRGQALDNRVLAAGEGNGASLAGNGILFHLSCLVPVTLLVHRVGVGPGVDRFRHSLIVGKGDLKGKLPLGVRRVAGDRFLNGQIHLAHVVDREPIVVDGVVRPIDSHTISTRNRLFILVQLPHYIADGGPFCVILVQVRPGVGPFTVLRQSNGDGLAVLIRYGFDTVISLLIQPNRDARGRGAALIPPDLLHGASAHRAVGYGGSNGGTICSGIIAHDKLCLAHLDGPLLGQGVGRTAVGDAHLPDIVVVCLVLVLFIILVQVFPCMGPFLIRSKLDSFSHLMFFIGGFAFACGAVQLDRHRPFLIACRGLVPLLLYRKVHHRLVGEGEGCVIIVGIRA